MLSTSKSIWGFDPTSIPGCQLWLDAADTATMNSTPTVTTWNDKSGQSNNVTGTATLSGSNMTFNGGQVFSNLSYVFPYAAYSLFAVYSNTTPLSGAYMSVVSGSNGYPMLGVYDVNKYVAARSVVANTGTLAAAAAVGWAARISSTGTDYGQGIATDSSGNVFVTGYCQGQATLYGTGDATSYTLAFTGAQDAFVAKYTPAGAISWAARIAGTQSKYAYGIATDSSGNVFVIGSYFSGTMILYNQDGTTGGSLANPDSGDAFIAKYTPAGVVSWAARITSLAGYEVGYGIATDSSGNVFVTGYYGAALTLYGTDATTKSLAYVGGTKDVFVAKYTSAGVISWAARIASTGDDVGFAIATDPSGNVFVTGRYGAALTLYGTADATSKTLAWAGGTLYDCFVAKYTSAGVISWAVQIASLNADIGYGIATDPSGNVFVTGSYSTTLTLYGTDATTKTLANAAFSQDCFVAKYTSAGVISWAAQIGSAASDQGTAIATDSSGNVFVIGSFGAALTLYNQDGTTGPSLAYVGGSDAFVAKYTSAGAVSWAVRIAGGGVSPDLGNAIATDSSGNVFVTGTYSAALTLYNQDTTTAVGLANAGSSDIFIAKYNPNGYITNAPTPASSNVLVSATYTPSTFSPFINGIAQNTLAGTTLATTGIYVGGPSNYFNGSLSELLVYNNTLTAAQRQSVEGYLASKWRVKSNLPTTHPFYTIPPFNRYFNPTDIANCSLWLDAADNSSMNSTTTVTIWNDKSGSGNTMTGTATWTGSNMTFNGSTQAFSNTAYVFPISAYSLFAVYSNTTAPASTAYMNVVYGSNGYPMLGVYDVNKYVSARSVVANTGALIVPTVGWAARIAGTTTSTDQGYGIATDPSGNVFVTGIYGAALTLYGTDATTKTLAFAGGTYDAFVANYTPAGVISWAARIAGTGTDYGNGIATDSNGNVFVIGIYNAAVTLYGTDATTKSLANAGGNDVFIAKYTPSGVISWATRIASTSAENGYGIATDPSGNVFVTGFYGATLNLYNQDTTTGASLAFTGSAGVFVAKYTSAGVVSWAARIVGAGFDVGYGIATDSGGNVLVTGTYDTGTLTLYSTGDATNTTLTYAGTGSDVFVAKYTPAGVVSWAARIASAADDRGNGIATDSSGNVFVTGYYNAALTLYNQDTTAGPSLAYVGGSDAFVAKYTSAGAVSWAARIAGTTTSTDQGNAIATDSSGNVFVTGQYSAALTLYGTGDATSKTLAFAGGNDAFVAKYTPAGAISWAARIASAGGDFGRGIATDRSGNVFVTGDYANALTLYNQDTTTGASLAVVGGTDCFVAKYNPNGYITNAPIPASSNVLVSATYVSSVLSPFANGNTCTTLAGATLATTGIYVGGPSNYFNGSLSELIVYSSTLTAPQRQRVEGYLVQKWKLSTQMVTGHLYKSIPPAAVLPVSPTIVSNCTLWLDGADNSSMNSTTTVTSWSDKSGVGNTMTGTATWSGSNMTFNGSTQAFSNLSYVFPISAYSLFAVYSNTTAPAASSYMNVVYGSNGYPMLGVYGLNRNVSARSVVANTGALVAPTVGWAARIAGTGDDRGRGIATDSTGNVFVTGYFDAALTLYNTGGTTGATLPVTVAGDCFIAKYTAAGAVSWAARIASTFDDQGFAIATDSSGNVFVTGYYAAALTLYGTDATTKTLAFAGTGGDAFVANYTSAGVISWAARIASTADDQGLGIATDPSGNVFVSGYYSAALTLYGTDATTKTLALAGTYDTFVAKYTSAGAISWAVQIASTGGLVFGNGIATDSSGNVFVTGYYAAALTLYGTDATTKTLTYAGSDSDGFVAKYTPAGVISWAARIASTGTDYGFGIATDSSGNVFVTGSYGAALTLYGTDATTKTLAYAGTGNDAFVAKYTSAGVISWAARIASTADDFGNGIATDLNGNVFVTGFYGAAVTLYNQDGTTGASLAVVGGAYDVFVAKYNPNGYITNAPTPASSNVLVSATYTPSTFSPFINGNTCTTLAGTTLATTGIFVGGPTSYFNGSLSELLVFSRTLTTAERQQLEGYLAWKWNLVSTLPTTHPYYKFPPAVA